jgi:hypothetical protein
MATNLNIQNVKIAYEQKNTPDVSKLVTAIMKAAEYGFGKVQLVYPPNDNESTFKLIYISGSLVARGFTVKNLSRFLVVYGWTDIELNPLGVDIYCHEFVTFDKSVRPGAQAEAEQKSDEVAKETK